MCDACQILSYNFNTFLFVLIRYPQWSKLPTNMTMKIMQLTGPIGMLSLGATCMSFRHDMKEGRKDMFVQPGMPTIIASSYGEGGWGREEHTGLGVFSLHDLGKNLSFECQSDLLRNVSWVGGKNDWLLTSDAQLNLNIMNLVTHEVINLPRISNIPEVRSVSTDFGWMPLYFRRVAMCRTPRHHSGYLVAVILSWDIILFTKLGDVSWTLVAGADVSARGFCDIILQDRQFWAVTVDGTIFSWDIDGDLFRPVKFTGPMIDEMYRVGSHRRFYLALTEDSHIILACLYGGGFNRYFRGLAANDQCLDVRTVVVYELDAIHRSWSLLTDFGGDRSLFLGHGYHFFIDVCQHPSPKIKANCVYLTDVEYYQAAVFQLGGGCARAIDFLSYPVVGDALQKPMWFRPATCNI